MDTFIYLQKKPEVIFYNASLYLITFYKCFCSIEIYVGIYLFLLILIWWVKVASLNCEGGLWFCSNWVNNRQSAIFVNAKKRFPDLEVRDFTIWTKAEPLFNEVCRFPIFSREILYFFKMIFRVWNTFCIIIIINIPTDNNKN